MKPRRTLLLVAMFLFLPFSAVSEEKRYDIPIGDSPSRGPENALVTIIEFIDFQ